MLFLAIFTSLIEVDSMMDVFDGSHSIVERLQFLNELLDKSGFN